MARMFFKLKDKYNDPRVCFLKVGTLRTYDVIFQIKAMKAFKFV